MRVKLTDWTLLKKKRHRVAAPGKNEKKRIMTTGILPGPWDDATCVLQDRRRLKVDNSQRYGLSDLDAYLRELCSKVNVCELHLTEIGRTKIMWWVASSRKKVFARGPW